MSAPQAHDTAHRDQARGPRAHPQASDAEVAAAEVQPLVSELGTAERPDLAVRMSSADAAAGAATGGDPRAQTRGQPSDASRAVLSGRGMLALQRAVGNRAVAAMVGGTIQRVPVKDKPVSETLYNSEGSTGEAVAKPFGNATSYDMTRSGDSGVTITVRIKFLSQKRNGVDPTAPGAPPGTPALGTLLDKPKEIPATDPRRAWATTTATGAVGYWNGRLTFTGEEWNLTGDNTLKSLPVTFVSTPVFGLDEPADAQVIIHPASTVAGTPGQPIDSGNWYVNKGTSYSGDDKVIAAHEYGHLLGIADEYSQSNEQMNALLHQAAPGTAPSAMQALDKATVERMVMVSMGQPLVDQLQATMPQVTDALATQKKAVKQRMAAVARAGVVATEVRDELRTQLTASADPKLAPSVPGVVAFETTRNFSNRSIADTNVDVGFEATTLSDHISQVYVDAINGANAKTVNVKGLGDVSIGVHSSVTKLTASGGGMQASAGGLATSTVGPAAAPGLPAIAPSTSLTGKLTALPTTWGAAGGAIETGVTSAAFASKMAAALKASAAADAAAVAAGAVPAIHLGRARELYSRAYELVQNASATAAQQVVADLIATNVDPVLQTSVSDLQASVHAEVDRVMGTPASGIAALGTPDPNMAALVSLMKTRLEIDKKNTAGTGRDPLGAPGSTVPAQDVTYSYQGMMGSNNSRALRPDQFNPMLAQFNDRMRTMFEKKFKAETK